MRAVLSPWIERGEVDIATLTFDPKSRDDIPQILRGLQHVYKTASLREPVFNLLSQRIAPHVDKGNGRPGMTLWAILVCGVLRLDLNIDYDRLHSLVNKYSDIRQMLGHKLDDPTLYGLQRLKDNVKLLTPELLDEINQLVVAAGHALVKKKRKRSAAWAVRLLCGRDLGSLPD